LRTPTSSWATKMSTLHCTCRPGRDHDGSEFGPCEFCEEAHHQDALRKAKEAEDEIIEAMVDAYDGVYEAELKLGGTWTDNKPNAMREALRAAKPFLVDDLRDALSDLVKIVDAAGLMNLSKGVQLGPTVWYVKASDAMEYARRTLSRAA
jgi:hypothetical protein